MKTKLFPNFREIYPLLYDTNLSFDKFIELCVNDNLDAVKTLNDQIQGGYSVLGEVDHPDDLKIN